LRKTGKISDLKLDDLEELFGTRPERIGGEQKAGSAIFIDFRLLLFPVESAKGCFAYVTSPLCLSRLCRDLKTAGLENLMNVPLIEGVASIAMQQLDGNKCLIPPNSPIMLKDRRVVLANGAMVLEAEENNDVGQLADQFSEKIVPDMPGYKSYFKHIIKNHLTIISDDNLKVLVRRAMDVRVRIRLNYEKKVVVTGGLFTTENIPENTVFYSYILIPARGLEKSKVSKITDLLDKIFDPAKKEGRLLIFGGDETVGRGLCRLLTLKAQS